MSPLLNYTTTVPASRTVAAIHDLLAKSGALQITTAYSGGTPVGVAFSFPTAAGLRAFILPVDASKVAGVLRRDQAVPNRYKTPEQAERVAWRIAKDWLEAQLAIVATEMVTLDQVMLPYMRALDGRTMWDLYLDDQLPALAPIEEE